MIRPRKNMSPKFATFKVPLAFNKLDLRDYLWHVYKVRVLSVRSMVNQPAPTTKGSFRGQIYRPLSEKLMIAELDKPFVWPEPPAEDERSAFDYDMWKKFDKEREEHLRVRREQMSSRIPLRTELPTPKDRTALAQEAEALLQGRKEWKNNTKLDDAVWRDVDVSREARTPKVPEEVLAPVGERRDVDIIVEDDKPSKGS